MNLNTDLLNQLNSITDFKLPELDIKNYTFADYQYELICESIKNFEDSLNDKQEVALKLASFGQSITLNVTNIGYSNPSLIHFYGYVGNDKAHLIQHVNQLNFLILAVPKADPVKPPRRIGFKINNSSEE